MRPHRSIPLKKTTYFPTTLPYGRSLLASPFLHLRTSRRSHNASTMNIPFLSKICQHIWHKIIDKKRLRLLVIPTYFPMSYPGKKPTKKTSCFPRRFATPQRVFYTQIHFSVFPRDRRLWRLAVYRILLFRTQSILSKK